MDLVCKITKYELLKDTVESSVSIEIWNTNTKIASYNLKYPSNPFMDIDILKFNEAHLNDVLKKTKKILKNKKYSHKSLLILNDMYNLFNDFTNSKLES